MGEQLVLEHGGFELFDLGSWVPLEGQTSSRNVSKGQAYQFRLRAGKQIDMVLGEVHWDNRDWEVRALGGDKATDAFRRLERGLRMGVQRMTKGRAFAEIRIARCRDNDWSNMFQTTEAEMRQIIGMPLASFLKKFGAIEVGRKEDVFGDTSNRRNELCVVFNDDDSLVPIVTYFVTRVLPISQNVQA